MNAYLKIGIAAIAAIYITPSIINRFVVPEIGGEGQTADTGALSNAVTSAGITGLVTAGVYCILSMAAGGAPA